MPLITAVMVGGFGFLIAKWYENKKEKNKIRENLILDLTELERQFFYLGFEWNKWLEEIVCSEEPVETTEETDLQEDTLTLQRDTTTIAFIDFRVLLNRMSGKLRIYLERKLITPKEYLKRIKKGEDIEVAPGLWAHTILSRLAIPIEESLETYKLPKDPEQLKQDFQKMAYALSSFYPDILSK